MGLNKNQIEVMEFGEGTLLVEAGPGSGKTKVLVSRIEYLIREKDVPPESFLVITFTRKAAENLKVRLKKSLSNDEINKMQISTIHSFCLKFLRDRNKTINLIDDDSEERKILFVQKHKEDLGFTGYHVIKNSHIPKIVEKFGEYTNFDVRSEELIKYLEKERKFSQCYKIFIDEHDYFTNEMIENKGLKDDWYNARFQQVARAYPKYLELLDDKSMVDYNTLQLKALEELRSNPETPYTTILIDEFQDTDPLQFEIFKELRKNAKYFTAVGDVDQRIYSFRSTFKDYFDEFEKDSATRLSLNCNYRSTENIVDISDKFIKYQRSENSIKDLKAFNNVKRGGYDNHSFIIETDMPKKRTERKEAYIAEADKIFNIIKDVEKNTNANFKDIAVLYRKHSSRTVSYLVDKLQEAGIPFSIKGQADLIDQKEVKAIMIMLWYITRKLDDSYIFLPEEYDWLNLKGFYDETLEDAFWHLTTETKQYLKCLQESFEDKVVRVRNEINPYKGGIKPFRTTGNERENVLTEIFKEVKKPVVDLNQVHEDDRKFFEKLEELREETENNSIEILKVYYELLAMSNYFEKIENNMSEVLNLATLTQTISNYEEYISYTNIQGLFFFLRRMIRGYSSNYDDEGGVHLMTVHAAKGLEFPVVIIPSLQKDEFPMRVKNEKYAYTTPNRFLTYKCVGGNEDEPISIEEENKRQIEEEERVIYVAMTRAADLLILSCLGENPEGLGYIKSDLMPYSPGELKNVTIEKDFKGNDSKEQIVLNYSKYTKFCSCPFKFNLGYNLGFRRPGGKAANRGTVFHNIMEEVNLKLKQNKEVSEDELIELTYKTYKSMFDIDKNPEDFETFKDKVIAYYNDFSKNREVLEAEYDFEIDRGEYVFNGSIDLIYKTGANEIVILDYKYAEYDEDHIGGYTKQLHLYAAALKSLPEYKDYKIKKAITHFVLGDGKKDDYQHKVDITDEKIDNELKNLDCVAKRIKKGKYRKKFETCDTCSYRIFCSKRN